MFLRFSLAFRKERGKEGQGNPTFICAIFFSFFPPCPPHPSGNFLSQSTLFLGPQNYSLVEERELAGAGLWEGVWTESPTGIGIMPGWWWHGKQPKAEMAKKWTSTWKTAPNKNGKNWPKNGKIMENPLNKNPFLGHFLPFLPLSSLGPFRISIFIFSISGFGRFPCHASPA